MAATLRGNTALVCRFLTDVAGEGIDAIDGFLTTDVNISVGYGKIADRVALRVTVTGSDWELLTELSATRSHRRTIC